MVNLGGSRSIARMACITLVLAFVSRPDRRELRRSKDLGMTSESSTRAARPHFGLKSLSMARVM